MHVVGAAYVKIFFELRKLYGFALKTLYICRDTGNPGFWNTTCFANPLRARVSALSARARAVALRSEPQRNSVQGPGQG